METWYVGGGRLFDAQLTDALKKLGTFIQMDSSEFLMLFRRYIQSCLQGPRQLNIVIDIACETCVRHLITLVRQRGTLALDGLKVVVLSTFESWGGRHYSLNIQDASSAFGERVPLNSACETYAVENMLTAVAERSRLWLRIVGCGLFYGGDGLDFRELLMAIWENRSNVNTVAAAGAVVPVANVWNFTSLVCNLLTNKEEATKLVQFIPAVDRALVTEVGGGIGEGDAQGGSIVPFVGIIERANAVLNGEHSVLHVTCDYAPSSGGSSCPSWRCHLPFSPALSPTLLSHNLISNLNDVWAEFLQCNELKPLSILVTGPPRTGKTDAAKLISARLNVELISAESAVRFLFGLKNVEGQPKELADVLSAAHSELRAAAEAKANEGKKPAKGAPAPEEGVIDEAIFTPAFCQSLPAELLRKCASAQVRLHPVCRRRGFVLDLWDGKTVVGADSLKSSLNSIYPQDYQQGVACSVDLVAELHCPSGLPVERLVASQGAQAKAKDSQAAVKALEAQVASYVAGLVSLPAERGNSVDGDLPAAAASVHMTMGHKGVLEIVTKRKIESEEVENEGEAKCANAAADCDSTDSVCSNLIRLDCTASDHASAEGVANALYSAMQRARSGKIGWLSDASPIVDAVIAGQDKASRDVDCTVDETVDAAAEANDQQQHVGEKGVELVISSHVEKPPAAAPKTTASIAEEVNQLNAEKLDSLKARSSKLEAFLTASVLPQLAAGMVQIQRDQPEDPIMFLAEHLLQHSAAANKQAEEKARQRFVELLHTGGGL